MPLKESVTRVGKTQDLRLSHLVVKFWIVRLTYLCSVIRHNILRSLPPLGRFARARHVSEAALRPTCITPLPFSCHSCTIKAFGLFLRPCSYSAASSWFSRASSLAPAPLCHWREAFLGAHFRQTSPCIGAGGDHSERPLGIQSLLVNHAILSKVALLRWRSSVERWPSEGQCRSSWSVGFRVTLHWSTATGDWHLVIVPGACNFSVWRRKIVQFNVGFVHQGSQYVKDFVLFTLLTLLMSFIGNGISVGKYRTRATISCSWLVSAPLCFQAKTHFYVLFMW